MKPLPNSKAEIEAVRSVRQPEPAAAGKTCSDETRVTPGGDRLLILWGAFFASRALVLLLGGQATGDVGVYHEYVARLDLGENPYGEAAFGYPPLAFLFVLTPRLFGDGGFESYYAGFRALCFVVDVATFFLLTRRNLRFGPLLVYLGCTTLLASLLFHRLDLMLGLLLLGALLLLERGRWRTAHLFLGVAISYKVLPVFLVPVFLAWTLRDSFGRGVRASAFLFIGIAVPMVVGYVLWGAGTILFLGGHAGRGVQLESTWASAELLTMLFGAEGKVYWAAGCHNLETRFESVFASLSLIALAGCALAGGVLALRSSGQRGSLRVLVALVLTACLVSSKVFSPQFLLFLLPVLTVYLEEQRKIAGRALLLVAICVLTTWVYPYHEESLTALEPVAVLPLLARNGLMLVLVFVLWRDWRRAGKSGAASGPRVDAIAT